MSDVTIANICEAVRRFSEINSAFSGACLNIGHELLLVQHIEKLEAEIARLQEIVERATYSAPEAGE